MRRLYVGIDQQDMVALVTLARSERRHPSEQATILLKQALEAATNPPAVAANAPAADDPEGGNTFFVLCWLEVLHWSQRAGHGDFSRREAHMALPGLCAEDIDSLLTLLVGRGYVRRKADDPASPVYVINSHTLECRNLSWEIVADATTHATR